MFSVISKAFNNEIEQFDLTQTRLFLTFKQGIFKQFRKTYSAHYVFSILRSDEYKALKVTRLPCYYDAYKIHELVLNKRSHFNALYKENMMLSQPKSVLLRKYHKLEQNVVLKNIMMVPKQFPPNLFACGDHVQGIIANRQLRLINIGKRRYAEYLKYKQLEMMRSQPLELRKDIINNEINQPEYDFHVSQISLSDSFKTKTKHIDNIVKFYFKQDDLGKTPNLLKNSDPNNRRDMEEIELIIDQINKAEQLSNKTKPPDLRRKQATIKSFAFDMSQCKLFNKTILKNNMIINKNSSRNLNELYNSDRLTEKDSHTTPRKKFKSVKEFIHTNNSMRMASKRKQKLFGHLVTTMNEYDKEKTTNLKRITSNSQCELYTSAITEKNNKNDSSLHYKTKLLFKNIDMYMSQEKNDKILSRRNIDSMQKFPMIYCKNYINSNRNHLKRILLSQQMKKL